MTASLADLLGQSRTDATNEERMVLALEAIAHHLAALASIFIQGDYEITAPARSDGERNDALAEAVFENEGGSLRQEWPPGLDITRTTFDQFSVGEYRYTNLNDAIAQARRSLST